MCTCRLKVFLVGGLSSVGYVGSGRADRYLVNYEDSYAVRWLGFNARK